MQTSSIEDDSFLKLFFAHIHLNGIEQYLVVLSALIAVIYLVKNIYLSFLQNVILSFSYTTRMNLATRLLTTYMNEPYTFHLSKKYCGNAALPAVGYVPVYDIDQLRSAVDG